MDTLNEDSVDSVRNVMVTDVNWFGSATSIGSAACVSDFASISDSEFKPSSVVICSLITLRSSTSVRCELVESDYQPDHHL